jgi:hypothetical protein
MPVDLRVVVPNRPGSALAAVEALAEEDINVDGFCGDIRPGERWGYMHFLVEKGVEAAKALGRAGFEVTSMHNVEVHEIEDKPGSLAAVIRKYREAGRNVEVLYATSSSRVVIGPEDMREEMPGIRVEHARYT